MVYWIAGIIIFLIVLWRTAITLFVRCGLKIISGMPLNTWMNYDEVRALTRFPELLVWLVLTGLVQHKVLVAEPDPEFPEDVAETQKLLDEDTDGSKIFEVIEFLRFRRDGRFPPRKKKRFVLLPDYAGIGAIAPVPVRT